MGKYTTLTDMGVGNPEQIARYTIHIVGNDDVLRIIYSRKKGDFLPVSKTFKFPRVKKSVITDSGTRKTQVLFESVPTFHNALSELEKVLEDNNNLENLNQVLIDEITQLEAEVASRIDYIKTLVQQRK